MQAHRQTDILLIIICHTPLGEEVIMVSILRFCYVVPSELKKTSSRGWNYFQQESVLLHRQKEGSEVVKYTIQLSVDVLLVAWRTSTNPVNTQKLSVRMCQNTLRSINSWFQDPNGCKVGRRQVQSVIKTSAPMKIINITNINNITDTN